MDTKCIAPHKIMDGDLITYIDGEASGKIKRHIRNCAYCTAVIAELKVLDISFQQAIYREKCPDMDMLLLFQSGLLSKTESYAIKLHADDCLYCQHELQQLSLEPVHSKAAVSLKDQIKTAGKKIIEGILLPPSPEVATVLRGRVKQEQIYEAENYRLIIVKHFPIADEMIWQIEGQLIHQDYQSIPIQGQLTIRKEDEIINQDIDEFGYFNIENLGPGNYDLQVELESQTIVIKDFTIP